MSTRSASIISYFMKLKCYPGSVLLPVYKGKVMPGHLEIQLVLINSDSPVLIITIDWNWEGVESVCNASGSLHFYTNGKHVWSHNDFFCQRPRRRCYSWHKSFSHV